ncbi:MAG: hypothetical protein WB622_02050 [Acidobacteriaceae bacterium]
MRLRSFALSVLLLPMAASDTLFLGFDRARAISARSAESIACIAQRFGREDDITVLTLTRAIPQELSATLTRVTR